MRPIPKMMGVLALFAGRFSLACETCGVASAGKDAPFDAAAAESLGGFFSRLFHADFMPHGHCYWWKPEIVWLHLISDGLIALAYFSIPLLLYFFLRKRKDLPFPWMFHFFAMFILWCGVTHLLGIVTLWVPIYRAEGVVKAVTAGISIATAFLLVPLIPRALQLRSAKELEEKNRELEEANRKIRESQKVRSEFLANVSHELRTPLTLILSPLETLLAERGSHFSDREEELLRTIHGNSVRLLQMITSLLDLSSLEAGRLEVKREPLDAMALARSVFGDFLPLIQGKRIEAEFESFPDSATVSLDRYLFERLLFNLLSNALKFTPPGGKIKVSVALRGDRLRLEVSDTGIGISDTDQKRIFQRFMQVEGSSTRRFEGTGLGLSLVKDFAALLGGSVDVNSKEGHGSAFAVDLFAPPASGPERAEAERGRALVPRFAEEAYEESDDRLRGDRLPKILVAEDNVELARHVKNLLSGSARIRWAPDGEKAWELVQAWEPDVVLSDVMMPGTDGLELCRRIKADSRTSSVAVVLLTALTGREALLRGWEAGADEYLYKPFHPAELLARMRSILTLVAQRKKARDDKARMEELQQFSYIAAHDLKEPLRNIRTFAQILERRYASRLDGDALNYLGHLTEGAERMNRLIEDLSSYAALDSVEFERCLVSTEAIVQGVLGDLQTRINDTGALVTYDELPQVHGSPSRLSLLFQNLITNAIKFRKPDEPPRIHISATKEADHWLFTIADNGVGFEQRYAERIFLVFKRLHDRKAYPGSGIGLAICRRIVEQHGGKIWATSRPSQDARFSFTLPGPEAALASQRAS